jgi:hypothetical protein
VNGLLSVEGHSPAVPLNFLLSFFYMTGSKNVTFWGFVIHLRKSDL